MSDNSSKELMIDLLFSYASVGDLERVQYFIETRGVDVNATKHNLTALSVCAAKSGDIHVVEYLLSKGSQIRDSHLHAIRAGNVEVVELLLPKLTKAHEMAPIKDSALFSPYMTPLMLAAISGHRVLVELLMHRGHTIPVPHLAHCECDDCNVSSTSVPTPSQRNLDIYRAMCNPVYIGLNSDDWIKKVFELESECRSVIENSNYFSHHYNSIFNKMQAYVTDVIDVARDAEEVKVLVKQRVAEPRNVFIKYLVLQKAVDNHWVDFVASKRIEGLRSHLWLGHNKVWFHPGVVGLAKKFATVLATILGQLILGLLFVIRYYKHITAQTRYLCRLFNESLFALVLLYFLAKNQTNERNRFHSIVKLFVIVWTLGNIVNITKKCAIFGLKKLWRFYGHVFEIVITVELLFIICLNFMCAERDPIGVKTDNTTTSYFLNLKSTSQCSPTNQPQDISTGIELKYILLRLLVKLIYVRLVLLSSLRAYKGSEEHTIIRLFLLAFCLVTIIYVFLSNTFANNYTLSPFDNTLGVNMFGDIDPTFIFIAFNLVFGLTFEIVKGPEKISDKFWCYHWTARLVYEIHGACELAVPFNIFETHRVLYILLKRVGFTENVNENDVKQYDLIKRLVYSRYDCIQYLNTKSSTDHRFHKFKSSDKSSKEINN